MKMSKHLFISSVSASFSGSKGQGNAIQKHVSVSCAEDRFVLGLDKEGRTTEKLDCLLEYFSRLPVNVQVSVVVAVVAGYGNRIP